MSALHDPPRERLDAQPDAQPDAQSKPAAPRVRLPRLPSLPGLPARYAAIVASSALLLIAAVVGVPAGPARGQPLAGVVTALASALGLTLALLAALPPSRRGSARCPSLSSRRRGERAWLAAALLLALLLAAGTAVTFAGGALFALGRSPTQGYTTDIVAFGDANARLTLAGRDPYTSDGAFWATLRHYPDAMVTPFQRGRFAASPDFPTVAQLYAAQRADAARPNQPHPAFDARTLHSYPALAFLVYVPLLAAGVNNVLWLHVIVYWALFAWLVWLTPVGWRAAGALVAGTALTTVGGSLFTANDVICAAFILTAWRYRRHAWRSAALLGLGCAFKQSVWLFAPLLLAETLARCGWTAAAKRGLIGLGAFLAPNLPYIIASPGAWWASLWLPMAHGMFRQGVGLVALAMDHALPYAPEWLYAGLEVAALLIGVLLVWRHAPALGEAVPLLALIPLFFAARAFASYFAFAPWLALYAVNVSYAPQRMAQGISRSSAVSGVSGRWLAWRWKR